MSDLAWVAGDSVTGQDETVEDEGTFTFIQRAREQVEKNLGAAEAINELTQGQELLADLVAEKIEQWLSLAKTIRDLIEQEDNFTEAIVADVPNGYNPVFSEIQLEALEGAALALELRSRQGDVRSSSSAHGVGRSEAGGRRGCDRGFPSDRHRPPGAARGMGDRGVGGS